MILTEGDITNGSVDGDLEQDGPEMEPTEIRLIKSGTKRMEVGFHFEAQQGTIIEPRDRFFTFNYADMTAGEKTFIKAFWNTVVNKVMALPQLNDSVEQ